MNERVASIVPICPKSDQCMDAGRGDSVETTESHASERCGGQGTSVSNAKQMKIGPAPPCCSANSMGCDSARFVCESRFPERDACRMPPDVRQRNVSTVDASIGHRSLQVGHFGIGIDGVHRTPAVRHRVCVLVEKGQSDRRSTCVPDGVRGRRSSVHRDLPGVPFWRGSLFPQEVQPVGERFAVAEGAGMVGH